MSNISGFFTKDCWRKTSVKYAPTEAIFTIWMGAGNTISLCVSHMMVSKLLQISSSWIWISLLHIDMLIVWNVIAESCEILSQNAIEFIISDDKAALLFNLPSNYFTLWPNVSFVLNCQMVKYALYPIVGATSKELYPF